MGLTFRVGAAVPSLWIDGPLPLLKKRNWKVKLRGNPKSTTPIPLFLDVGELLCGEHPSPLQHWVTLMLRYQKSNTPPSATPPQEGGWTEVPNSPIYDQIHIALSAEAIAKIRETDADAEGYSFELALDDIELEPTVIATTLK